MFQVKLTKATKAGLAATRANGDVNITTNLLGLNDDCLLEIFAYFDIADLYSLSKVCRRFFYIVVRVAKVIFPSINMTDPLQMGDYYQTITNTVSLQEFLSVFGPNLLALSLSRTDFTIQCPRIFDVIAAQCTQLKTLNLHKFVINKPHVLFQQIEKLVFRKCHFENKQQLRLAFENCANLTSLVIDKERVAGFDMLFQRQFSVSMPTGYYLLECFDNLRELDIQITHYDHEYVSLSETIKVLAAKNMLEVLKIHDKSKCIFGRDFFDSVLWCKRLTILIIKPWSFDDHTLNRIAECLPLLEIFVIHKTSVFSLVGLKNFVSKCDHLTHLGMKYFGDIVHNVNSILDIVEGRKKNTLPLVVHLEAASFYKLQELNLAAIAGLVKFEIRDKAGFKSNDEHHYF